MTPSSTACKIRVGDFVSYCQTCHRVLVRVLVNDEGRAVLLHPGIRTYGKSCRGLESSCDGIDESTYRTQHLILTIRRECRCGVGDSR